MTFLFLENVCVTLSLLLILFCLSSFRDSPVTPVAKSASITSRFWWLLISINMKSFITGKCSFLRDGANLAIAEQRWRHHIALMVNLSLASPTNMVNVNKKRVGGEFESTCKDELGQILHIFEREGVQQSWNDSSSILPGSYDSSADFSSSSLEQRCSGGTWSPHLWLARLPAFQPANKSEDSAWTMKGASLCLSQDRGLQMAIVKNADFLK